MKPEKPSRRFWGQRAFRTAVATTGCPVSGQLGARGGSLHGEGRSRGGHLVGLAQNVSSQDAGPYVGRETFWGSMSICRGPGCVHGVSERGHWASRQVSL